MTTPRPTSNSSQPITSTFPTYRDTTKKIATDYGTRMYPETYLIDRQGKIARKIIGPQAWDEGDMLVYVQSLLIQK